MYWIFGGGTGRYLLNKEIFLSINDKNILTNGRRMSIIALPQQENQKTKLESERKKNYVEPI